MPSRSLLHLTTPSGWKIVEDLNNNHLASGGNFCCRYIAKSNSGEIGFLKAMDLTRALNGGLQELQNLVIFI